MLGVRAAVRWNRSAPCIGSTAERGYFVVPVDARGCDFDFDLDGADEGVELLGTAAGDGGKGRGSAVKVR